MAAQDQANIRARSFNEGDALAPWSNSGGAGGGGGGGGVGGFGAMAARSGAGRGLGSGN